MARPSSRCHGRDWHRGALLPRKRPPCRAQSFRLHSGFCLHSVLQSTCSMLLRHPLPKARGLTSAFPAAGRVPLSTGLSRKLCAAFIWLRIGNCEANTLERVPHDFPDTHTRPFSFLFPKHAGNDERQQDSQGKTPKESQPRRGPR